MARSRGFIDAIQKALESADGEIVTFRNAPPLGLNGPKNFNPTQEIQNELLYSFSRIRNIITIQAKEIIKSSTFGDDQAKEAAIMKMIKNIYRGLQDAIIETLVPPEMSREEFDKKISKASRIAEAVVDSQLENFSTKPENLTNINIKDQFNELYNHERDSKSETIILDGETTEALRKQIEEQVFAQDQKKWIRATESLSLITSALDGMRHKLKPESMTRHQRSLTSESSPASLHLGSITPTQEREAIAMHKRKKSDLVDKLINAENQASESSPTSQNSDLSKIPEREEAKNQPDDAQGRLAAIKTPAQKGVLSVDLRDQSKSTLATMLTEYKSRPKSEPIDILDAIENMLYKAIKKILAQPDDSDTFKQQHIERVCKQFENLVKELNIKTKRGTDPLNIQMLISAMTEKLIATQDPYELTQALLKIKAAQLALTPVAITDVDRLTTKSPGKQGFFEQTGNAVKKNRRKKDQKSKSDSEVAPTYTGTNQKPK